MEAAGRIQALPEQVVNKIAAGEVIQRPFSAVKELIENSIDAGATQITVTIKGAGTLIQVQDNGQGIHQDDLNIICRRFNTSKLRKFEDLKHMTTYGFRGEALASMTHVARVTITTQKPSQPCSFRASYKDGAIVGKPSKCAGVPGTTITVEDLFYNVPQRLRALKSAGEEYGKVLEVVQKYAIHYSGRVGFTCKRAGVHSPDLHTLPSTSIRDNISKIYGADVGRELVEFIADQPQAGEGEDVLAVFQAFKGMVTNPNFHRKKGEFLLFINGRLVESSVLKRTLDSCYADCLPKGGHPFVYLSLELPLENVDVNVHPTKREVQFLHEDEINDALARTLKRLLMGGNESRSFETMKVRPRILGDTTDDAVTAPTPKRQKGEVENGEGAGIQEEEEELADARKAPGTGLKKKQTPRPEKLVRTDAQMGSGLERFLVKTPKVTDDEAGEPTIRLVEDDDCDGHDCSHKTLSSAFASSSPAGYIVKDDLENAPLIVDGSDALELESIKSLIQEVEAKRSPVLCDGLKRSVFVGVVDARFSLIQYDTSLVAIDHAKLAREMFYQRILALFGRFRMIKIQPAVDLKELFGDDGEASAQQLCSHADLLYEYFGVDVRNGRLSALPRLLPGHLPQPRAIPGLMRAMITKVDWSEEKACFQSIAKEIAAAYAELPAFRPLVTTSPNPTAPPVSVADKTSIQYIVKNVLHPGLRTALGAPQDFADPRNGCVVPLTRLEQLYRIFERC